MLKKQTVLFQTNTTMQDSISEIKTDHISHQYVTKELLETNEDIWINPIGGYGDIIMISTALHNAYKVHGRKFKMVRRTQYTEFLAGHPAIELFGYPTKGSHIVGTDYWSRDEFANPQTKALQVLTQIMGGNEIKNDCLYLPFEIEAADILMNTIPWGNKTVVISPNSESLRKMMHPMKWHFITETLVRNNYFVLQLGKKHEQPIKGAYSLLGVTTPRQAISIIKRADFVVTPDNFIMHAAQYAGTPTIALFGPTLASQYGYSKHFCMQANLDFCNEKDSCLGTKTPGNYTTPCPHGQYHCMEQFSEQKITDIIFSYTNKNGKK